MPTERLQKILARAGIASRRASEQLIREGRVTVDGRVVSELGVQVDPAASDIRVDGKSLAAAEAPRYIMLNKPAGYLSGPDPRAGYPAWQELVKVPERLFAVGRLDHDSEGLLLLTNDGELANALAHPRYGHAKTYLVQVEGVPNPRKIRRWQHGVMLDDGPTLPARVTLLREPPRIPLGRSPAQTAGQPEGARSTSWLQVTLREGRKRQVRRMTGLLGHPALRVIRTDLGPLHLADLKPGRWRDLTPGEVRALREAVQPDLPPRSRAASGSAATGPASPASAASVARGARSAHAGRVARPERKNPVLLPCIIAIDGPAASGKSTIGARVAEDLGYLYFDTGVMYRALTWVALARSAPIDDEDRVTALAEEVLLDVRPPELEDGRDVTVLADGADITWDIRKPEVDRAVSPVSAYKGVRQVMRDQQRRIGLAGRVIMVGRDIGTVVLPEADLKIYLDASLAVRAHRRFLERQRRGEEVEEGRVLEELRRRDEIDSKRAHAPLTVAADAIVVDSTDLGIEEVVAQVHRLIRLWGKRHPQAAAASCEPAGPEHPAP